MLCFSVIVSIVYVIINKSLKEFFNAILRIGIHDDIVSLKQSATARFDIKVYLKYNLLSPTIFNVVFINSRNI